LQHVELERNGYTTVLTISRPAELNALNPDVLSDLDHALDLILETDARCVVVTGAGNAFVAGADISHMREMSRMEAKAFSENGLRVMRKVECFPLPVIAAVNGYALGGGCELALACDIRIASENAVFALPEVGLGIMPGFGGTQRLPRLVGPARAKELVFTGRRCKAAEALAIGLVNAIHPLEDLITEALAMAHVIASNAPIGVRAAKQSVDLSLDEDIDLGAKTTAELLASCFETFDQRNAMSAFALKQKPAPFQGR
jgi:enoyl-CoA hydratase